MMLSPTEAAKYLGINRTSLYRLIWSEKIPTTHQTTTRVVVCSEDLDEYKKSLSISITNLCSPK